MQFTSKNKSVIASILWFVLGFAAIALIPTQVITMERYRLVIAFLLVVAIGLIACFKNELFKVIRDTKWYEVVILMGVSLLIHAATSYGILAYLDQPIWPFDSRGVSFLLMNGYYIWAKPIDIFLQQMLVILLVLRLNNLGVRLDQITKLFVVGFGIIHIFQILRTDLIIGLAFTVAAILFSFVFPRMILKVRNGYIYNFVIHLVVYDIAALLAWMLY